MQVELKNMQQRLGITFIYVTHDQEEALTMSDTIVVLKDGVIQQIGTPTDVYNEPKNPFVADFIGESNILPGIMVQDYKVRMNGVVYECVDKGFGKNTEVDVVVRPEDIDIIPADKARVSGKVVSVVFMGVHYEVDVDCGGYEWVIQTTDYVERGETIGISIPPDAIHVMKKTQQTNLFDALAYPDDEEVEFCGHRFACKGLEGFETKDDVLVAIVPGDVLLIAPQDSDVTGFVKACMFLGTHYEVTVTCDEEDWIAYSNEYMEPGEEIGLAVDADKIAVSANGAE
jgi:spermidine/putrescine transport system ATP-binding protein